MAFALSQTRLAAGMGHEPRLHPPRRPDTLRPHERRSLRAAQNHPADALQLRGRRLRPEPRAGRETERALQHAVGSDAGRGAGEGIKYHRAAPGGDRAQQTGEKTMTKEQLDNLFTYHKPFGTQPERYEALRAKAKELAHLINESCPESREKSIAITHLQNSVMLANASIAVNEVEPPTQEAERGAETYQAPVLEQAAPEAGTPLAA